MSIKNNLSFDFISTPIGVLVYYWDELGICKLEMASEVPKGKPRPFFDLGHQLIGHFRGLATDFSHFPLNTSELSSFENEVLEVVRQIPYGQTMSYKQVALKIGKPRAYQAVGQALKKNPFPIIVPCHRVRESHGTGGYSFGQGKSDKFFLLELERGQQFFL